MVSMREMLEVLREFEALEPSGVSLGLIAWELYERDGSVAELIAHARERGLIELAGADTHSGEPLWRLTQAGRQMVTRGPRPAPEL